MPLFSLKSAAALDKEYMAAVEAKDTNKLQHLVDAAAKKAGYTIKAYHGTYNFGRTVFDKYGALFLTSEVKTARNFSNNGALRTISGEENLSSPDQIIEYVNSNTYLNNVRLATEEDIDYELKRFNSSAKELRSYGYKIKGLVKHKPSFVAKMRLK